jgi:hypothetical protein
MPSVIKRGDILIIEHDKYLSNGKYKVIEVIIIDENQAECICDKIE